MFQKERTTNSVRGSQHITGAKRRIPPAPPPPLKINGPLFRWIILDIPRLCMRFQVNSISQDKTGWAIQYIAGHCNQINIEQEIYYIEILNTKLLWSNFYLQVESSADKNTGYYVTFASYNNLPSVDLWLNIKLIYKKKLQTFW